MVYETIDVKDGVLRIDAYGSIFGSSIEDFDVCMAVVIDKLMEEGGIKEVVFMDAQEYEYVENQVEMLQEISNAVMEILYEKKIVSYENMGPPQSRNLFPKWYPWLYNTIAFQLRGDPIGAYVSVLREIRHLKILREKASNIGKQCIDQFLSNALYPIKLILGRTKLILASGDRILGHRVGDRSIYRDLFHPLIRPRFMPTKYTSMIPKGELIKKYRVGSNVVSVFSVPGKVRPFYHMSPPEFNLNDAEYSILSDSMHALESRRPRELEMSDQSRTRDIFLRISEDLVKDVADVRGLSLSPEQVEMLAQILTRYTAGFGFIELLLEDENIQDININSPLGKSPVYIVHSEFEECETNLIPTRTDGDRLATRFKLLSGRPLDEANPVLDTEMVLPGGVVRVAAIAPRLSPEGLAFAFRKHRYDPWTFPLYVNNGFFSPMLGGLMWFMAEYGRSILVAGTRGAGKTSFLGSLMLQVLPYYRIITTEDTFELPVEALRRLGYNVERLKSRSVITKSELELSAEDVIRTALRLGDSSLFIGEVRSIEAKALYEAMRVGALANIVAGTIHGESAYGVFDRVVNDLGVPITSFKATDLVVVCNKLRPPGGLRSRRRVVEVTEIRKHWNTDPVDEHGFVNLLEYSSKTDELRATDIFLNGESYILNDIARKVPGWHGRWDAIWDNINLRAKVLKSVSDLANSTGNKNLMEADNVVRSNQIFSLLSNKSRDEFGAVDPDWVYKNWLEQFKLEASGKLNGVR